MAQITPRLIFGVLSITGVALVLIAAYAEPFASMNPCPMCMMQRAVFLAVSFFAAIAFIFNPQNIGKKILAGLAAIASILGAAVAGRQIWLQHLPEDQVPACGPGLEYMMEVFPLLEVLRMSLQGTGDCAEVQWTWLGLSIPGWSLVAFSCMFIACVVAIVKKNAN